MADVLGAVGCLESEYNDWPMKFEGSWDDRSSPLSFVNLEGTCCGVVLDSLWTNPYPHSILSVPAMI